MFGISLGKVVSTYCVPCCQIDFHCFYTPYINVQDFAFVTQNFLLLFRILSWFSLSVVSDSCDPWTVAHRAPLSVGLSRQEYWRGLPCPPPGDLPNPGIEPGSSTLQVDSLPAELQGKPKNTGVGSLSLLQWIFLTQQSNQDLLHCRLILYQLSYEESSLN